MDYSKLVEAVQKDDEAGISKLVPELFNVLVAYLRAEMGANQDDAKDCAQQALITGIENIRSQRIHNSRSIHRYLLTICRNNYLRMQERFQKHTSDFNVEYLLHPESDLQALLDQERMDLLYECLLMLTPKNREFIEFWFRYPGAETGEAAERFGISVNNAWIRKHRIIKTLNRCIEEKYL